MSRTYDTDLEYEVVLIGGGLSLAAAVVLAQTWAEKNGGKAEVWRRQSARRRPRRTCIERISGTAS